MKTNPGLPMCPKCGRRFTVGDLFDPTHSSDLSYIECEYKCTDCETEGNMYFDFASITQYEKEEY